ncbi:MAG: methionyl-tRNA formyltransferase [Spirochaetales bacterium]|nr:methionyl-tRNA formyltransferase [Spirochaetales bacterium]
MRILFAGTPEIAAVSLRAAAASHTVAAVLTNPDRAAGRGRGLHVSPVKAAALELGLPALQPEKLDAAFRDAARGLKPELLVSVAYGKIFGPRFLECFPRGGINLHPSLLPRYRGPSPINAAILNGDSETGITIQSLALEMDAGDIILQERLSLTGKETAESLTRSAAQRGAVLLVQALDLIAAGKENRVAQDPAGVTYCGLLDRAQGKIDWKSSAAHIERMTRAFDPWPGAWTGFQGLSLRIIAAGTLSAGAADSNNKDADGGCPGKVLGVDTREGILIQTGDGILAVRELQLQSKKAMDFASFLNGVREFTGSVLGDI